MAAFDHRHEVRSFSERHEDHFHPSATHAPERAGVLLYAGHRPRGSKGLAALRENDGIDLSIVSEEFPAKPGEPKRPPGFVLLKSGKRLGNATMNALNRHAAWNWLALPLRKLKRKQLGFALYEAERRPGLPARVANAHARFEYEARQAARDWLML